ncbi:uncharacterized protein LOC124691660 [Lolium rigidum]|uniref:uncharacterized protein LOC124691660 n=1 Tax=Lolium rigidum TaxID=89674 RepID=UPI001F5D9EED|nr:uncharacterized protein LOC124691660 [Lolium rigidum]
MDVARTSQCLPHARHHEVLLLMLLSYYMEKQHPTRVLIRCTKAWLQWLFYFVYWYSDGSVIATSSPWLVAYEKLGFSVSGFHGGLQPTVLSKNFKEGRAQP